MKCEHCHRHVIMWLNFMMMNLVWKKSTIMAESNVIGDSNVIVIDGLWSSEESYSDDSTGSQVNFME